MVNSLAKNKYDRLQTGSILRPLPLEVADSSLTVSFLNIHSLKKHIDDLLLEKHL